MPIVSAPKILPRAIQYNQVARNGQYPLANTQVALAEHANHINLWCTQSIELGCPIASIPALSATARTRWRAAYHSSPFAQKLYVKFEAAQINDGVGTAHASKDPYVKVLVELADGTDVGTAELHFGYSITHNDSPAAFGSAVLPIVDTDGNIVDIPADTDLFITVSDEQSARAIAVAIYEINQLPSTSNGYAATNTAAGSPILSADRQTLLTNMREQWLHGAAGLWYWASNTDADAPTRITASHANWIDQTITGTGTVAASEPGVKLHLANKSTVRRLTVTAKFWVHAKMSAAATTGHVYLYDEQDGELANISVTSNTAAWYSATVNLAEEDRRYAVRLESDGTNTLTLYAFSLLQYEA